VNPQIVGAPIWYHFFLVVDQRALFIINTSILGPHIYELVANSKEEKKRLVLLIGPLDKLELTRKMLARVLLSLVLAADRKKGPVNIIPRPQMFDVLVSWESLRLGAWSMRFLSCVHLVIWTQVKVPFWWQGKAGETTNQFNHAPKGYVICRKELFTFSSVQLVHVNV